MNIRAKVAKLQIIEREIDRLDMQIGVFERLGMTGAVEQNKNEIKRLNKEWQAINAIGSETPDIDPLEQIEFPEYC